MPDDPRFSALLSGLPLTPEVVAAAKRFRLAQIDELWTEVRILERLTDAYLGPPSVLLERDPPLETAQHPRH